jgi:hypothetical protein
MRMKGSVKGEELREGMRCHVRCDVSHVRWLGWVSGSAGGVVGWVQVERE